MDNLAPSGAHASAVADDPFGGAIREFATIMFSFALVAVIARLLGVGGTLTLQPRKGKVAKGARVPMTVTAETSAKSPTAPTATKRHAKSRPAASPQSTGQDRLAMAANALAGAVNAGKAAKLPQLIDEALARLARAGPVDAQTATAQASQLLLSSLRACASKRCFREAVATYDHMEHLVGAGCCTTWRLLLWSVVEAGLFERGSVFAQKLRASGGITQNDIVNLPRCMVHNKDLKQFGEILAECQAAGLKFDVLTRNRVLAVMTSSHAMDFAGELVSRTSDVPLDVIAYNTLMKGYALSGKPKICLELYHQMLSVNVTPS